MASCRRNQERLIKEIKKDMKGPKKEYKKDLMEDYKKKHKKEKDYEKDYQSDYEYESDDYDQDEEYENTEYGYEEDNKHYSKKADSRGHNHEILGSVMIADREDPHSHRFATVSGPPIPYKRSHVHEIRTNTDFYEDHKHQIRGRSGIAIEVGDGRHVHFASGETTLNDGHRHDFRVASLIEDPTGEAEEDNNNHHGKDKNKKKKY